MRSTLSGGASLAGSPGLSLAALMALDLRKVVEQEAELVDSIEQAAAGEAIDRERCGRYAARGQLLGLEIDGDLERRVGRERADQRLVDGGRHHHRDQAVLERVAAED